MTERLSKLLSEIEVDLQRLTVIKLYLRNLEKGASNDVALMEVICKKLKRLNLTLRKSTNLKTRNEFEQFLNFLIFLNGEVSR